MKLNSKVKKRRRLQWILLPIVIITLVLGWKWPLIGFTVPVVMLTGMIGGFINGRYVCGNLCPRGSFLDRVMSVPSPGKHIPKSFRNMTFRWLIFSAMMGFMVFRVSSNPGSIDHWGKVFWMMCVITTGIGITLALFIHPRSWCSFCPIGTMQRACGGGKNQLLIDEEKCKECRLCEKACPFDLKIVEHKSLGHLPNKDCLKCGECIGVCKSEALSWPD